VTRLPSLGPRGEGWVLIQLGLLVLLLNAGALGPAWDGTARVVTTVVGTALLAAGGLLAVRGLLDLRGALTALPRPRAGASLVDTGAYALVRHPIYGGLVLGGLGFGLILAAPAAMAVATLLLAFFRLKSAREEAWLVERYPAYADYRGRTKRMIPWVY
jgi:protein-S-isoprenylcysteine O-methyltransferase Ste14